MKETPLQIKNELVCLLVDDSLLVSGHDWYKNAFCIKSLQNIILTDVFSNTNTVEIIICQEKNMRKEG